MKKSNKKASIAVALMTATALTFWSAGPAGAVTPVADAGAYGWMSVQVGKMLEEIGISQEQLAAIKAGALDTIASIKENISASIADADTNTATLYQALLNHSGQLSANLKAQTAAEANMNDLKDQREVQRRIEDTRLRAIEQTSGGATGCNIITGIVGSSPLFIQVNTWKQQLMQSELDYFSGGSQATGSGNGAMAGAANRVKSICSTGATQDMLDSGLCPSNTPLQKTPGSSGVNSASSTTGTSAQNPSGPQISNSLNGAVLFGTSVLSPADQKSAKDFLATVIAPIPMGATPPGSAANTEQGFREAVIRQGSMARVSVAWDGLNDSISRKVPITDKDLKINETQGSVADSTKPSSVPTTNLRQWAEGTSSRMLGYGPNGTNFPNGISMQGWMEVRARSFYLDPAWSTRINGQSADANSKDIALILGFQTFMQYEQFHEIQRMNVTLATMLGIMDEQNRRAQGL